MLMNRFRKTPILQQCRRLVSTDKSTVDAREVEKFQKLGSQWWDSSSEMKILHNMNRLRVPFVRDGLINMRVTKEEKINTDKPLEGLKILDVGCGGD
ncbi:PREDICTED: ubiquinone biosynthesis O-methyltransferase, mitochondrial-like [Nicrophorus vespilloides]|uniref:Ubiquinone biosynthesis O-methyltransferase, mitochondrial-like n=1 Tax=Nicrophorus vespilloides TaxID=110193 RepID=A0ABM1MCE3_NICVS|nr:PREDICTED: ubiquinone biosynthesis O-methyltransferase, mitochondrial-like [Nicrophorus vespilloides]